MSNFSELPSIDSVNVETVVGGAEPGPWEGRLDAAGRVGGLVGGALVASPGSPVSSALAGYAMQEIGGAARRQLGRAIDNPHPRPGGGVNGGNGAEQMSP